MKLGRFVCGAMAGFAFFAAPWAAGAAALIEPPELVAAVADGKLPPVNERLPETPAVVDLSGAGQSIGAHEDTGSSQINKSGCNASARAMPRRWR